MRPPRSSSSFGVLVGVSLVPSSLAVACAYEVRGVIEGQLVHASPPEARPPQQGTPAPADAAPAPTYEQVRLTWSSSNSGQSGQIQTVLPGGEAFTGSFHEITSTLAERRGGFCGGWGGGWYSGWYGGPWVGPGWYWGGAWPYYDSCGGFITYYSNQVVAVLEGDRGRKMRCHFTLDDTGEGLANGGWGECQVSNGDRITAIFDPTDAEWVQRQW